MPHDTSFAEDAPGCELPGGFRLLQGQYQIERPLISGGFGITYLARDSLERRVVIKECFPAGLCRRDGTDVKPEAMGHAKAYRNILRAFLREAQWLAKSQHPGIAQVHQVFKENQTAYIAMECIDGLDLLTVREEQPERLTGAVLKQIMDQALDVLGCIHKLGVLHRDISPDNFLLDKNNKLTLIDFGAACGSQGNDSSGAAAVMAVKDGYSAHELYQPELPHRPVCDLYALGATFYYLITGDAPPHSQERLKAVMAGDPDPCKPLLGGGWNADPALLATVDMAMSVLPAERFQSARDWAGALSECEEPEVQPVEDHTMAGTVPEPAAVEAGGDGKLVEAIADLVARTNGSLTPGKPRAARAEQAPPPPKPQAEARPLVNLFGEPVTDLEAWLQEEDAIARRRKNTPPAEQPQAAADTSSEQQQSFAGRLRKILGRRPGGLAPVRN
ncbi:serine/threonine protein kinase [Leisingera sp. ANG-Vp]|uniref:serine/threonine protein kinase n=1 Tax=Leisingera sp. ANG-Vp TaxID=1577896 RepID=UPI00058011BD|nr:serine/threonine-protein kinase [Leisingera sp. ANG-Vp]KIC13396.1 serine/threonine protein kinase [Leisingera sp. ANG-Vp]